MDRKARRRQYFEANLEKMELQLERVEISPAVSVVKLNTQVLLDFRKCENKHAKSDYFV